jgi:NAD(P)-dependent dehydrogenase (short-subunit alcohol dehydrogenase family)
MKKPICVVVGVGPGNGSAIARRFAKEGYKIVLLARSKDFTKELAEELSDALAYQCDVSDISSIKKTFGQIKKEFDDIDAVIYNAGSGTWGNVEEITPEIFEASWRINTLGLFATAQEVIPAMKKKGKGSIIIIGATASRRGGIKTAAFASAKAAQHNLAESMAKYAWPHGIHVALVIIDGVVDLPKTRKLLSHKPDDFFVKPDDVASTVFWLTQQPQSAWSFEVEARPYKENW